MASSSSLMASETLLLRNPNLKPSFHQERALRSNHVSTFSHFTYPKIILNRRPKLPSNLTHSIPKLRVSASSASSPVLPTTDLSNPKNTFSSTLLSDSTRSITSIFAIAFSISKLFANAIQGVSLKLKGICLNPTPEELGKIQNLRENLVCTVGPLFFAALRDRPSGYLNTPLTVVASGMAKWLDIYSGVLMVRVLLSWFPNIPWDRQPLSAIRDLCDPYLNLFRNIIPPIFDTLDVSPLLAFAVLGTLGSILNNSRGAY
ncbi:Uncharacterized protein family Ycf19 [Macleaya cordata]|uniref:Uncharacterized protein family Ycf19 n=1 Tax=Macleaya cordata TaxID=56857 RepID=A0A200Q536_MACCD|nr:Uncharacterized protein family Ycf19 [Macleaya cordata]